MPIYEYRCQECGKTSELLQRMSDPPMAACPLCGGPVKKLISSPAVQFKGSGWYVTDYGSKKNDSGASGGSKSHGGKASEGGSSSEGGGKDGGGKSEGGGESKAAEKSSSSSSSESSSSSSSSESKAATASKAAKSSD
jgi:putative FmdB family regulatory protein